LSPVPDLMKAVDRKMKKYPIYVNSFEAGLLTGIIGQLEPDKKGPLKQVFDQLLNLGKKFREESGVTVTGLGNDVVQLRDRDGKVIIRQKYDWEEG